VPACSVSIPVLAHLAFLLPSFILTGGAQRVLVASGSILVECAVWVVVLLVPHVAFRPNEGCACEPRFDTQLDVCARRARLSSDGHCRLVCYRRDESYNT